MRDRRHEPDRISVRGVLLTAAGLAIALNVILFVLWMWWNSHPREMNPADVIAQRPPSSPGPLDQLPVIRRELYGAQRERLESFGWIDEEHGIAHMPIDQAIERMVREGWPVFRNAGEDGSVQP